MKLQIRRGYATEREPHSFCYVARADSPYAGSLIHTTVDSSRYCKMEKITGSQKGDCVRLRYLLLSLLRLGEDRTQN